VRTPVPWSLLLLTLAVSQVAGAQTAPLPVPGELPPPASGLEARLRELGVVDVRAVDPTIACDLKYSSADNFMGRDVYGAVDQCFLLRQAAIRLAVANAELRSRRPDHRLLVVDGLRPRGVQRRMWALVEGTPQQPYVANPRRGSMHNHGAAVDLTIVDRDGRRLDMGTPMDHFGPLAQPRLERHYLEEGALTPEQVANRLLLREVMVKAGFRVLQIEWWHFNAWDKEYVRSHFPIIEEFPAGRSPRDGDTER